jgi:hypothetical protein
MRLWSLGWRTQGSRGGTRTMFNPRKHFGIDYTRGNKITHGKPSHTRSKAANRIRIDHTRGKKLNTDLYNDQNYQRVYYVEDHIRQ